MEYCDCNPGKSRDIVDVLMRIMSDEGPIPMKNLLDTRKRLTGAEQFNAKHVAESKPSGDAIERQIHEQVGAVPKLKALLKKKKATTTVVTTIKANAKLCKKFDPCCTACAQILTYKQLRKLKVKPRCSIVGEPKSRIRKSYHLRRRSRSRTRSNRHGNSNDKDSNTKSRLHKKTSPSFERIWKTRSSQWSDYSVRIKESIRNGKQPGPETEPKDAAPEEGAGQNSPLSDRDRKNSKKDKNAASKDPSASSVSSYHSYKSMDHEPMDHEPVDPNYSYIF